MSGPAKPAGIVPASLSFLAIYNPSLSQSDESLYDQIVYYYSKARHGPKSLRGSIKTDGGESQDESNKRLRQIGLAQGMVQFAAGFSDGAPVDTIETEKSRIVIHNLETEWWLLISVDLTYLPKSPSNSAVPLAPQSKTQVEYSAREVSPPTLLLQQILRAHQVFLVNHSASLTDLFSKVSRDRFCGFLSRFWDYFLGHWDVLLHGNPAVDIYNGIKLSAGGELGIGVGEEEWGSGEREVLEGFIGKTDGLVDLMVSRFEPVPEQTKDLAGPKKLPSKVYGTGDYMQPSDGLIFSGIGSLTRSSIRNVSAWVEWIAMYGADAYGIRDNPTSDRRQKRTRAGASSGTYTRERKKSEELSPPNKDLASTSTVPSPPSIPAPIVGRNGPRRRSPGPPNNTANGPTKQPSNHSASTHDSNGAGSEIMKYLTLGIYGSSWGIPVNRPAVHQQVLSVRVDDGQKSPKMDQADRIQEDVSDGYFLVGLLGDLEAEGTSDTESSKQNKSLTPKGNSDSNDFNDRVIMRYLHVDRMKSGSSIRLGDSPGSRGKAYYDRLRVVVYVHQPFIFTFLFEPLTDSLAIPSFYRSLHQQLGPLQRALLKSTDPEKVAQRLWDAASTKSTASTLNSQPIHDLVYDPARLTVHTSIPNIPELGLGPTDTSNTWTRVEALSVHSQILNSYISTRRHSAELERTCKTNRGWWVMWMRLPHPPTTSATHSSTYREAFLIRKASDYVPPIPRASNLGFRTNIGGTSGGAGWGTAKLAEGIGIDARQYIDGLLSLNR
ncbi:MAG: hypothetical protein Q9163_002506 [Psora crenata]